MIFRNEITTILTPSTSEGSEWERWGGGRNFFVLEVPDYESAMFIYISVPEKQKVVSQRT